MKPSSDLDSPGATVTRGNSGGGRRAGSGDRVSPHTHPATLQSRAAHTKWVLGAFLCFKTPGASGGQRIVGWHVRPLEGDAGVRPAGAGVWGKRAARLPAGLRAASGVAKPSASRAARPWAAPLVSSSSVEFQQLCIFLALRRKGSRQTWVN